MGCGYCRDCDDKDEEIERLIKAVLLLTRFAKSVPQRQAMKILTLLKAYGREGELGKSVKGF